MTAHAPRACLMGHQVAYSRSPMLHGYWLRSLGIAGTYELVDIASSEFPAFFRGLREHGFAGGNITKPHKATAFRLVDRREPGAEETGAVNCVWYEGDALVGGNTDVIGFLANLDDQAPGWDAAGGLAVIIGAGGAASAVIYGLLGRGMRVAVVNRTPANAEALCRHFGARVSAHPFDDIATLLGGAALLTNTSVLGAPGQPPLDIDLEPLGRSAVVCDVVYVPLLTPLLAAAQRCGHRTADGLGMLIHQAAPAFAKWFGVTPPVTAELRALLETDIRRTTQAS
jgi:shikimate dehydrogenase